jgi:hypothetical protein
MLYNQNQVKVGISIQPEIIANCDVHAEYFSQSSSGFMNEALKLYVNKQELDCFLLEEREKNGAKIQTQKHEEALVAYATSASWVFLNKLLLLSLGWVVDRQKLVHLNQFKKSAS